MPVFDMKNSCVRVYRFDIPSNVNGHFTTNKLLHLEVCHPRCVCVKTGKGM